MTELTGKLTQDQIARIVGLCDTVGKQQGPASYAMLGDLMTALQAFEQAEEIPETKLKEVKTDG